MEELMLEGKILEMHDLSYFTYDKKNLFVYEREIIQKVCEGNHSIYEEHFSNNSSFIIHRALNKDEPFVPLFDFLKQCLYLFELYDTMPSDKLSKMNISMIYVVGRIEPLTQKLKIIQRRMTPNQIARNETPSSIFIDKCLDTILNDKR